MNNAATFSFLLSANSENVVFRLFNLFLCLLIRAAEPAGDYPQSGSKSLEKPDLDPNPKETQQNAYLFFSASNDRKYVYILCQVLSRILEMWLLQSLDPDLPFLNSDPDLIFQNLDPGLSFFKLRIRI